MDLIKIGKYIAGKRKSLGMTQKPLTPSPLAPLTLKNFNTSF